MEPRTGDLRPLVESYINVTENGLTGRVECKTPPTPIDQSDFQNALCRVVEFSLINGHNISNRDLYHCHVVAGTQGLRRQNWQDILENYQGLLCHGHELDNLRTFQQGRDNTNIVSLGSSYGPRYLGVPFTANIRDLAPLGVRYPSYLVAQVNFYEATAPECQRLKESSQMSCGGRTYCMGFFDY